MNRIHRTVWNQRRGAFMAAAENTRSEGKASGTSGVLLAGVLMGLATTGSVQAAGPVTSTLPTGAQVTAGQAQIGVAGSTLTVTQGSAKAAINWSTFSIGKDAAVDFVQPNAGAVALNRVTGRETSVIDGALNANGQVFILNPNGVLFGKGSRVDTAGLVASTLSLSDADFLAGRTGFAGHGGAVVNEGSLTAKDGGYIALFGQQVKNEGTITARLGTVALAAGDKVSLNFNGNSLVGVAIDRGALDALVANGGAIRADGGLVVLTAKGAEGLVDTLVNNTGEVRAQTVENKAGRIYLLGEGGKVEVAGTLDASAPGAGDGGFVETSGSKVHVADSGKVTTLARQGASGRWLIDPTDFTVAESGGDITGAALSSNLASGSVTIQSTSGAHGLNGDIVVNDPVSWGANTTLTLEAQNNIYVFSNITATGASGKLALYYGQGALASGNTSNYFVSGAQVNLQAGQNFDTKQGSDGAVTNWTVITALGFAGSVTGTDLQGINGNQSGNFALGADIAAGATTGWNAGAGFDPLTLSGNFDGLGHKIDGLFINKSSNFAGLFGSLYGTARNVGVTNADVTGGGYYTGALAGYSSGLVEASYSTGSVTGDNATGGLVGYNDGTVKTSFSGVHVTGGANVGGLVGNNWGYVLDTYATGAVYGLESVGGLIGNGYYSQEVSRSYAVGAVTADVNASYVGGLVSPSNQAIPGSANFWDVATTGQGASGTGTGLTTAQMTTTGTFTGAGWNFTLGSGVWARRDDLNNMYPVLRTFGYTDRIGVATLAPAYFADPTAGLSYTSSGLLSGDAITLAQSGSTLVFNFNNPARAGLYDALLVRGQATTGDLTVNRPISWSNFQLVLEAAGDINVNAVMSATGTATLDLKTGYNFNTAHPTFNTANTVNTAMGANGVFSGRVDIDRTGTGILTINNAGYTLINALGVAGSTTGADLQGVGGALNGRFALAGDIDAAPTSGWNSGAGFTPIGIAGNGFTGRFDGLGHTVSGLSIDNTVDAGLFGSIGNDAALRNLAMTSANFVTGGRAGLLVGRYYAATAGTASIDNVHVAGSLTAALGNVFDGAIGGLVGDAYQNFQPNVSGQAHLGAITIRNASADVAISVSGTSTYDIGGLVGAAKNATLTNTSAAGGVNATASVAVGGLVGYMQDGLVEASRATGAVSSLMNAGGLVGEWNAESAGSTINVLRNSAASGNVTSTDNVYSYTGGLVGATYGNAGSLAITGSHASGNVSAVLQAGGLLGGGNVSVTNSYATGAVTSTGSVAGGLIGEVQNGVVSGSYASGSVSGIDATGGLVGSAVSTTLTDVTASGAVSSSVDYVGGLVGRLGTGSSVTRGAASGAASGHSDIGGLVGLMDNATVVDSRATGNVTGGDEVGGLVGSTSGGTIDASAASGSVTGSGAYVGGLVGHTYLTTISHSWASGAVSGADNYVGGLVGGTAGLGSAVTDSYASGSVSVSAITGSVGGLVGDSSNTTFVGTYATGNVSGVNSESVGGLIGYRSGGNVSASYATGNVSGRDFVGGLIGNDDYANALTSNVYARGNVTGTGANAGGLIGTALGNVSNAYSTGHVTGVSNVGGLIGGGSAVVTNSFWDAQTSGIGSAGSTSSSAGGTGRSTADMNTTATFTTAGWDFTFATGIWGRKDSVNDKYPVLRAFGYTDPLTLTLAGASKNYGDANPALSSYTVTGCPTANCLAGIALGSAIDATTGVGTYAYNAANVLNLTFAGGYSASQFDLTLPTTSFSITPRPVSLTTVSGATRVYDRSTDAVSALFTPGNLVNGDSVSLTGVATLASADAGAQAVSSVGTLALNDANYTLVGVTPTGTVGITPRMVSVATVSGATRVYDAGTDAAASLLQVGGVLTGDTVNLGGTATLAGKNVGAQAVSAGTLVLDNGNYTLFGVSPTGSVTVTARPVTVATVTGAGKVYDGTTDAASNLLQVGGVLTGDTVNLGGTATLAGKNVGAQAVSAGTLALDNGNYTLVGVSPTGSVNVTARPVSVATVTGASKVYDGTTDAAGNLLQVGGVVAGETVNLTGTAALASKNVGAQGVTLGTLALDNANYTLAGTVPAGTVAVLPRTLNLRFVVADKTFDGSTAAGATSSDDRVRGDQLNAQFSAAFADTRAGTGKPVAITGLALQGADAGNYQLASGAGSGVTGNMLTRSVTYTLASQDPAKTYTATGQVLVSAASLDQLVVATFANTVTGTSPGALSYTLWKNGRQVDAIKDAGTYQVRASFAADDAHYALATTGNADVTIVVGAGSSSFASSPVAEVIAQAVRTEVPTREALQATPAVASAETRSPAEFTAMAPNVASRPAGLAAAFGEGVPLALISSPSGDEPSQSVTLEQAKRMVAAPAGGGAVATREVRVPVSRNSLAEIVNGGVKLPGGVDQLLFVVKADK